MPRRTARIAVLCAIALAAVAAPGASAHTVSITTDDDEDVQPGENVAAGYAFRVLGNHPDIRVLMANATVVLTGTCRGSGLPATLAIALLPGPYDVPGDDGTTDYLPSDDESSAASYQGSAVVDVCHNQTFEVTRQTFTADVQARPTDNDLQVKFHWVASGSKNCDASGGSGCDGPWSGHHKVTPDPLPPVTPSLSSSASGSVAAGGVRRARTLGGSITDTAHLSDGSGPTGLITFDLYGPGDATCADPPTFTTSRSVAGNGDYTSAPFTPTSAGTYRWRITYSGDDDNRQVGPTKCGVASETVVVQRSTPSLSTTASGVARTITTRSGARRVRIFRRLGVGIHDSARLTGGHDPGGTIGFSLYGPDDPTCARPPALTSTVPVTGNGTYDSDTYDPTQAGTYRWIARYSGDSDNHRAATSCTDADETVVVTKDRPSLATIASGAVRLGSPVSDSAILTRGTSPTGTITFELYGPDDALCSRTPVSTSQVNVSVRAVTVSTSFTPTAAGIYRWVARYSGDRNNESAGPTRCNDSAEEVDVRPPPPIPARPTLSTTASTPAVAGSPIRDTAHLSAGNAPTGAIAFALYGPDPTVCLLPAFVTHVDVSGNGDYPSPTFTPRRAGAYRWGAIYLGDRNNLPAANGCGAAGESVVVAKAQPALDTIATATAGLTKPIHDTAHLTGGSSPRGTITFALFGPGDEACSGAPVVRASARVAGAGTYMSPQFTPAHAGTYRWVTTYTGDANNNPAAAVCGAAGETSTINPADTDVISAASGATDPSAAGRRKTGTTGGSIEARRGLGTRYRRVGFPIYDTVSLSDGVKPRGHITYALYGPDNATCSRPAAFESQTAVEDNGDYVSKAFIPTVAGTYRWVATYSGDDDNASSATPCGDDAETVVVLPPAQPTLSTTASGAVTLGASVRDTAQLMNGITPTGTIVFRLYRPGDADCSGNPAFTSTVSVSGNDDYHSASFTPSAAGRYRWVASYSGDARNDPAANACGDAAEVVDVRPPEVAPAHPALSVTAASQTAARGTPIYAIGHLTGGSTPTGGLSFALYGPDDATCSRAPVFTSQMTVNGGGDFASSSYVVSTAGVYRWVAFYSGDRRNTPAGPTTCGEVAATVTVSPDPTPNPNTAPSEAVAGTEAASTARPPTPKRKARRPHPKFTG
jgi:hypothetical protein